MTKISTFLFSCAALLALAIGSGNAWAQNALQLTPDAVQVTQDFDSMWDSEAQAATLELRFELGAQRLLGGRPVDYR